MFRSLLVVALALPGTALAGYEVSSFRSDSINPGLYGAASALDSKAETCWMVDPEKRNEGQWISIDVPTSTVDKLALISGWDQTEKTFADYARIKKARVEIISKEGGKEQIVGEAIVDVKDQRGWQILDLPDTQVGGELHGGMVRVHVLETYPGTDYPNLAVSEVRVHLKEFAAGTIAVAREPDSSEAKRSGDMLIDGQPRTFWAADGAHEAIMAFKAPGYGLASIGIQPGPKPYARPKTVELTANDITVTVTLEDKQEMQWHLLPVIVGYTGGAWGSVEVKVVDSYPGEVGKGVAISEVKINAATIEDI